MSKKNKPQRVTFKSIFRLSLFLILVFVLISWFSSQNSISSNNDPTVYLGESIYSKLPENSRHQLENFNDSDLGKFITNSSNQIKNSLDGFPQKQIKEIKKGIIKNISDDMIKSIDEK